LTEDLMKRLQALGLKTYQLHWGWPIGQRSAGAQQRRHHRLEAAVRAGARADPWRNTGDLYFAAVSRDSYPGSRCRPMSGEMAAQGTIALRFTSRSLGVLIVRLVTGPARLELRLPRHHHGQVLIGKRMVMDKSIEELFEW
jgi:hypothetical protein